ncbi:MAG: 2-oxoacid:acceptor oxidoreductase family protein [Leptospiraceae bacterium]|nr:2-oxoacid:acceptor oxidoreductase family protein [Leptospiraceae bacterium]
MTNDQNDNNVSVALNGNGAVAYILTSICDGMIGYPITPSTEIAEMYQAHIADGGRSIWGRPQFFFEPEGEHSAQSGSIGAALTGGKFISNASSANGILYAMESHVVTVGKKLAGFVLQGVARAVSSHSLNVMAGHHDIYALRDTAGYTILVSSSPQEAADLALMSYWVSSRSLIPVAHFQDGFSTSHQIRDIVLPSHDLMKNYIGEPSSRIMAPTEAQRVLLGDKGRVHAMKRFLTSNKADFTIEGGEAIKSYLNENADKIEPDYKGEFIEPTLKWVPEHLKSKWSRAYRYAFEKGTRQLVPSFVDPIGNPGLTGGVQGTADYQAGSADHRAHFISDVPRFIKQAMAEYTKLTGREYKPVMSYYCDDADYVILAMGSITDDLKSVARYLREKDGVKTGIISIKQFNPFPENEVIQAIKGKKAVMVLERSDSTMLTDLVRSAIGKGAENSRHIIHDGIEAISPDQVPVVTTGIFGLGGHDVQPSHLIAAYKNMYNPNGCVSETSFANIQGVTIETSKAIYQTLKDKGYLWENDTINKEKDIHHIDLPHELNSYREQIIQNIQKLVRTKSLVYLGNQFFDVHPSSVLGKLQSTLKAAYPETELMALPPDENPDLTPNALRIRFHGVGGQGLVTVGKMAADIFSELLGMHVSSNPSYGAEKTGTPTQYFITLDKQPIEAANAALKYVNVVVSSDHVVFQHTNPLAGLREGGIFILQTNKTPEQSWQSLSKSTRDTIRKMNIHFYVVDAFGIATEMAPENMRTRMMGVSLMGALARNAHLIWAGVTSESLLELFQHQMEKKFGKKGEAILRANMEVVKAGMERVLEVNYNSENILNLEGSIPNVLTTANNLYRQEIRINTGTTGLFDSDYFELTTLKRFADGSITDTAPVLPGMGLCMPTGTAVLKDKGRFRLNSPSWDASLCIGCMQCALTCPDAAIPNIVVEIPGMLHRALDMVGGDEKAVQIIKKQIGNLSQKIHGQYSSANGKNVSSFAEVAETAFRELAKESKDFFDPSVSKVVNEAIDKLRGTSVAKTKQFFASFEKRETGTGGLYSVTIDPSKCTGCQECVKVCPTDPKEGRSALSTAVEDEAQKEKLQLAYDFFVGLPNTPERFTEASADPADINFLLDLKNYYAMTPGHGGCRGCGEVTSVRLFTITTRSVQSQVYRKHTIELENLLLQLELKITKFEKEVKQNPSVLDNDRERLQRMKDTYQVIEKRLYYWEAGPSGKGPATAVLANATGCSSVYGSTFPFNPYTDPWVNSLFQDFPALASGIYQGLGAGAAEEFKALRIAKFELEDKYNPTKHDHFFKYFSWVDFTEEEFQLMAPVIAIGGDGASFDIGWGALSRLLVTKLPVKVLVVDTGAYSNTGGQSSTASHIAQDADLSRHGKVQPGRAEERKELGIIASMHPNVLVIQTTPGLPNHYIQSVVKAIRHNQGPSLILAYTPCQGEHGIPDNSAANQARLAVESRLNPVFVHDPRGGATLAERFSLEGNPDSHQDWTAATIVYKDDAGKTQFMEEKYTPAHFAFSEARFRKQFKPLKDAHNAIPLAEYIELDVEARNGKIPFIHIANEEGQLLTMGVSPSMVYLTENRRDNWRRLQELAGYTASEAKGELIEEMESLQNRYNDLMAKLNEAKAEEEQAINDLAATMSRLVYNPKAPIVLPPLFGGVETSKGGNASTATVSTPVAEPHHHHHHHHQETAVETKPFVEITDEDRKKCVACGNCYNDMPAVFEKKVEVVDGQPRTMARVKADAFKKPLTDDQQMKIRRISENCEPGIIKIND